MEHKNIRMYLGLFLALAALFAAPGAEAKGRPKPVPGAPTCPLPNDGFHCRGGSSVARLDYCKVHGQVTGLYSCSVTATCRQDPRQRKPIAWDFHFTGSMECCDFLYDTHDPFSEVIPPNFKGKYCR